MDRLGFDVVQIACGDPHHADWDEGEQLPAAAKKAGFRLTGAMLGFPGEDYTTPQTIQKTGGFGDPATRPERLERFQWALRAHPRPGSEGPDAARRLHPRARPGRPQAVPRHAGQGGRPGQGEGRHRRLRDRPGNRRPAEAHPRRAEMPQPEGQFRPRQHAPLRKGRPDPRRRAARPLHPQRARQGRQLHQGSRHLGRGSAARPGPGQHQEVHPDAEEGRLQRPALHRARSRQPGRAGPRHSPTASST